MNHRNTSELLLQMANDPIFKNLVPKRMGGMSGRTLYPQRGKFQELVASGGLAGFWMEYKQNIKDKGKKQAQSPTKKEKTKQQKNDAQKVMKQYTKQKHRISKEIRCFLW